MEYSSKIQKLLNQKMEKQECKYEYAKKSIVEGLFEIFN